MIIVDTTIVAGEALSGAPERIRRVLEGVVGATGSDATVFLFGSRVQGENRPNRDWDIGILGEARIPNRRLALVREQASFEAWPYRMDVVDFMSAPDWFLRSALRHTSILSGPPSRLEKLEKTADG